jgi:2-oxoglutarate ferredoxin oxidoreductase subunit gamma
MKHEIIIAGFGGQGVLFTGKVVSYAGLLDGKEVTWMPSYGPEMRGGTANCLVTVSDEEISSPITENPLIAVVLNRPSLDKFEPLIRTGGTLMINSSLVDRSPVRKDVQSLFLPVTKLAEEINNPQGANMILVGACMQQINFVEAEMALDYFEEVFEGKSELVISKNKEAFIAGIEFAKAQWPAQGVMAS